MSIPTTVYAPDPSLYPTYSSALVTDIQKALYNLNLAVATAVNPLLAGASLVNVIAYQNPGTYAYTPTAGVTHILAKTQGAGAGGGGTTGPGLGYFSVGCGGGNGSYAEYFGSASSQTVTVGAGGNGGLGPSHKNGYPGGLSSFGTLCIAQGGLGGTGINPSSNAFLCYQDTGGPSASTGLFTVDGGPGGPAFCYDTVGNVVSGAGANSLFGHGGGVIWRAPGFDSAGGYGQGFGSGGSGAASSGTGAIARTGGAGAGGLVLVFEFR